MTFRAYNPLKMFLLHLDYFTSVIDVINNINFVANMKDLFYFNNHSKNYPLIIISDLITFNTFLYSL